MDGQSDKKLGLLKIMMYIAGSIYSFGYAITFIYITASNRIACAEEAGFWGFFWCPRMYDSIVLRIPNGWFESLIWPWFWFS